MPFLEKIAFLCFKHIFRQKCLIISRKSITFALSFQFKRFVHMAARGKYDKENIATLIAKLWGGITDDQFDLLKEHLEIKEV